MVSPSLIKLSLLKSNNSGELVIFKKLFAPIASALKCKVPSRVGAMTSTPTPRSFNGEVPEMVSPKRTVPVCVATLVVMELPKISVSVPAPKILALVNDKAISHAIGFCHNIRLFGLR